MEYKRDQMQFAPKGVIFLYTLARLGVVAFKRFSLGPNWCETMPGQWAVPQIEMVEKL